MSRFEEPTTLAAFDRSWNDKKEELRLERGEYQGKPTYGLRIYWKGNDGSWRWAAQKPTQSGKCWERLNLKPSELLLLGEALIKAAKETANDNHRRQEQPTFDQVEEDDIPF